jgi:hypothetical protein
MSRGLTPIIAYLIENPAFLMIRAMGGRLDFFRITMIIFINLPGEVEITALRLERMPDSPASYTALNAIFGFFYGSI